jgi:Fe-S cluster assembly protein SufB
MNEYPDLIEKYLGSVIPIGDNYFAALNSAVLQMVRLFIFRKILFALRSINILRINDPKSGQFENINYNRKNSQVNYLEGCTAPQYDTNQLHAAVVELIALENATIKYSTVQNWYSGNEFEKEGVYNFVTKRGLCRIKFQNIMDSS